MNFSQIRQEFPGGDAYLEHALAVVRHVRPGQHLQGEFQMSKQTQATQPEHVNVAVR